MMFMWLTHAFNLSSIVSLIYLWFDKFIALVYQFIKLLANDKLLLKHGNDVFKYLHVLFQFNLNFWQELLVQVLNV